MEQHELRTWRMRFFAGLAIAIVGFLLGAFSLWNSDQYTSTTTATVVHVESSYSRKRDTYTYRTQVTFEAAGQTHTVWLIDDSERQTYDEGQTLTVRYDPHRPNAGCVVEGEERHLGRLSGVFIAVGAAGTAFALASAYALIRERRDRSRSDDSGLMTALAGHKKAALAIVCTLTVAVVVSYMVLYTNGVADNPTVQTTELTAIKRLETAFDRVGETSEGDFASMSPAHTKGYVVARNNTGETVRIHARYRAESGGGRTTQVGGDQASAVLPGETVLLKVGESSDTHATVEYSIDCTEPDATVHPLAADCIVVTETARSEDTLSITVMNNGATPAWIEHVWAQGVNSLGTYQIGAAGSEFRLEPGASTDLVVDASATLDPKSYMPWDTLEMRYFVQGREDQTQD